MTPLETKCDHCPHLDTDTPCACDVPRMAEGIARRLVPLAENLRRHQAVKQCPWRADAQCGCIALARCVLGKGKAGEVTLAECLECVAEET